MLELDHRHRAHSPLPPKLRARARWVAADALGCAYSRTTAAADLLRHGGSSADLHALAGDLAGLPEAERWALIFARKMASDPHRTTDEEVARLVQAYGEKQVVALILLLAHANFQDRLLLALDLPLEADGPLPPLAVRFAPVALGANLAVRRRPPPTHPAPPPAPDREWGGLDFPSLLREVEKQRTRQPRIHLATRPGDIHWGLVCRTHQPELAAAWSLCRRRFGAEANADPVFEASVFWVVAHARQSYY
jgi:hypothetical protein